MARTNYDKIREFCETTKKDVMDIFKKSINIEDLLDNPEATTVLSECIKIYDESCDIMKDYAKQIDEMSSMLEDSYNMLRKMEQEIKELRA